MAQDTAACATTHFDLYLGPGEKAAHQAGLMKGTLRGSHPMPKVRVGDKEKRRQKSAFGGRP